MKQMKSVFLLSMALVFAHSLSAAVIRVKGPDTMSGLANKWDEAYTNKFPEIGIQTSGGSVDAAIAALRNRSTDICYSSRKLSGPEWSGCVAAFGKRPTEYRIAMDALFIYVNEDNPVKEVSTKQLKQIFAGKIRNWKELGGNDASIILYSREKNSSSHEFMLQRILQGALLAQGAQTMPGSTALLQAVVRDKNGIGFSSGANAQGFRALFVKKDERATAVAPNEESILSGKYPLARPLFAYVSPARDQGEVAAYLNWIRSDEGQRVATEAGCFPLPKNWRE